MHNQSEVLLKEDIKEDIIVIQEHLEEIIQVWDTHWKEINKQLNEISNKLNYILLLICLNNNDNESARKILKENFKENTISNLQQIINNNPKYKKKIGKLLTDQPDTTNEGRISFDKEIINRPYRSFKCDREKQILRHVATQLYFFMKHECCIPKFLQNASLFRV